MMMRNEGALNVRVWAVCLFGLLAVLAASGENRAVTVGPDDPLFGTWINKEYEGGKYHLAARAVIFPEGKEWDFFRMSEASPTYESRFTIVEAWIDEEGSHWYKTEEIGDFCPWPTKGPQLKLFGLTRINATGTIMEGVSRGSGQPDEISELEGAYCIYYRQK